MGEDLTSPPAPPDMTKLITLAAKYKIDILGPLPGGAVWESVPTGAP
jgi:hypothetical protein